MEDKINRKIKKFLSEMDMELFDKCAKEYYMNLYIRKSKYVNLLFNIYIIFMTLVSILILMDKDIFSTYSILCTNIIMISNILINYKISRVYMKYIYSYGPYELLAIMTLSDMQIVYEIYNNSKNERKEK